MLQVRFRFRNFYPSNKHVKIVNNILMTVKPLKNNVEKRTFIVDATPVNLDYKYQT